MTRRLLATVLVAVAACRQIAGLDDRATIDAVEPDAGGPDAAGTTAPSFCATAGAGFCDDFEGADQRWTLDLTTDAGDHGEVVVGEDGRDSAHALRARTVDNPIGSFRNTRITRSFDSSAQRVELSYAIFVPSPSFPEDIGEYQLSLLGVPGTFFYPILARDQLAFTWTTTDGTYIVEPSKLPFAYGVWHTFALTIDLSAHTVRATIDDAEAVSGSYEPSGNAGEYKVAIGLRTQAKTAPLLVRYDDVTVRFR